MKRQIGFVLALAVLAGVMGFSVVSAMGARTESTATTPEGVSVTLERCGTDGWTAVAVLRLDLPASINVDLAQKDYLFADAMLSGKGGDVSGSWTTLRKNNAHSVTIQYRCDRMCAEPVFASGEPCQLRLETLIDVLKEPPHEPKTLLEGAWVVDLPFGKQEPEACHAFFPNPPELPAKRMSGEDLTILLTDYQIRPYGVTLGYTFESNTIPEAVELRGEVKLRLDDKSELLCAPSINGIAGTIGKAMFQLQAPIHPNQITALLIGDMEIIL